MDKTQVLLRFELRLEESESSVITNYTIGPIIPDRYFSVSLVWS